MLTVTRFVQSPPEVLKQQLLELAMQNRDTLALALCDPEQDHDPEWLWEAVQDDILNGLARIGDSTWSPAGLLVATDNSDPKTAVGFLLHDYSAADNTKATLNLIVVHEDYRRKGVAQQLLARLRSEFPDIRLECSTEHVPLFWGLGFTVHAEDHPILVSMGTLPGESDLGRAG